MCFHCRATTFGSREIRIWCRRVQVFFRASGARASGEGGLAVAQSPIREGISPVFHEPSLNLSDCPRYLDVRLG